MNEEFEEMQRLGHGRRRPKPLASDENHREDTGTHRELFISDGPMRSAHCLLPTAYCLLPTAHCPLPIADYFPYLFRTYTHFPFFRLRIKRLSYSVSARSVRNLPLVKVFTISSTVLECPTINTFPSSISSMED